MIFQLVHGFSRCRNQSEYLTTRRKRSVTSYEVPALPTLFGIRNHIRTFKRLRLPTRLSRRLVLYLGLWMLSTDIERNPGPRYKFPSKVSRGNSEYRVILNTSRTMLCYFSSINSCTPVLHLQVGLEGSFDRSISCHCRLSLHIVRLQNVQSVTNFLDCSPIQTLQYSSKFAIF